MEPSPAPASASATASERVCAVVVTYNRLELLRECLTALGEQTRRVDRVLVIDNASTDGTPDAVRSEFPWADLVELPENRGGAGGFHEGTKRSYEDGFDWIWLMDDDTIPTPTALEKLLEAPAGLDGLPRALVLASRVDLPDGTAHPFNRLRIDQRRPTEMIEAIGRGFVPIRHASFVSAMVHRDAVKEYGLPHAGFFIWLDDVEFTARILREDAGYGVPASIVIHKSHTRGAVYSRERYYYAVRNTLYLLRSGSLRGDRAMWSRYAMSLVDGIPAYLRVNHFSPTALRTVLRALIDGLREIPA
jgi:rhamnopyranosyl-N-acetylglucosaminyl-diphospho-decaprenol beta-1,3/1,4-galactofuranosyltransferase